MRSEVPSFPGVFVYFSKSLIDDLLSSSAADICCTRESSVQ